MVWLFQNSKTNWKGAVIKDKSIQLFHRKIWSQEMSQCMWDGRTWRKPLWTKIDPIYAIKAYHILMHLFIFIYLAGFFRFFIFFKFNFEWSMFFMYFIGMCPKLYIGQGVTTWVRTLFNLLSLIINQPISLFWFIFFLLFFLLFMYLFIIFSCYFFYMVACLCPKYEICINLLKFVTKVQGKERNKLN